MLVSNKIIIMTGDMLLCVIKTGIMNNSVFLAMDYNGQQIYLSSMPSNISSSLYTECMLANVTQSVHSQMYFSIYSMAAPGHTQGNAYKTVTSTKLF